MERQLKRALKQTRTVELRLDWLATDEQRARFLGWLRRQRFRATLIATCRRGNAGGRYRGDVAAEMDILARAVEAGCSWCDVEIESAATLPPGKVGSLLRPAKIIISFHDFRKTPGNLGATRGILLRFGRGGRDVIKIATAAKTLAEGLRVISLAHGRSNVVAVPMGDICAPLRVLALREGSALGYAPVERDTAAGQFSLDEMRNLFRADEVGRETRVYGVIGSPVEHSLSPILHNAAFKALGMNAVYLPFLVRDLRDFLSVMKRLGIAGFSVTLPHKAAILRYLDDCDPLTAKIGAVNTVIVRGGKLIGRNTDYAGVLSGLQGHMPVAGIRVLLFGAGGAARAAAFALAENGASVFVCSRRPGRARALARAVGGEAIARSQVGGEFFDAIVNATPVGMYPHMKVSPLMAGELHCRIVMDLIYRPMRTRLVEIARRRGLTAISGVEMFLAQGIAQWEMWTGRRAPAATMRRAVLTVLHAEERAQAGAGAGR